MAEALAEIAGAAEDGSTIVVATHGLAGRVGACRFVGLPFEPLATDRRTVQLRLGEPRPAPLRRLLADRGLQRRRDRTQVTDSNRFRALGPLR